MKKLLPVLVMACATSSSVCIAQSRPAASASPLEPTAAAGALNAPNPANSSAAKAREMLQQMVDALGGNAWLTYKTSMQQGRSYSFYQGNPASAGELFWRYFEYPDKERSELTKQRDVINIFNGDRGYETTYKGTAAQDAKSIEQVKRRRRHSLESAIREWLQDPRTMLFYDGQSVADRQLVDVVTLLNKDNDQISIGIDSRTHLPINTRYSWRDQDKYKVEEETLYGNYRKVQGIQTPFTITHKRDGEMSGQSFLSHAAYNIPLAPGFFEASVTYDPKTWKPAQRK